MKELSLEDAAKALEEVLRGQEELGKAGLRLFARAREASNKFLEVSRERRAGGLGA